MRSGEFGFKDGDKHTEVLVARDLKESIQIDIMFMSGATKKLIKSHYTACKDRDSCK